MQLMPIERAGARPVPAAVTVFHRGDCILRQGDDAGCIYEVLSGVIRVTRLTEDGRRQILAFAYPGDVVGFAPGGVHMAECDAITDARVTAHDQRALSRAVPALRERLAEAAIAEIARMQDQILTLGRLSAAERVAGFLWRLGLRAGSRRADGVELALPMRRADIADHLGLTIETVSRAFTRLRGAGLIALRDAKTVVVPDLDALGGAAVEPDAPLTSINPRAARSAHNPPRRGADERRRAR